MGANRLSATLFSAVSAFALLAGPSLAADLYTPPVVETVAPEPATFAAYFGEAEGAIGYTWLDGDPVGDDEAGEFLFGTGALRLGFHFWQGMLIQGDLFGEITDASGDDDSYVSGWGGAGHLAWRNPSQGLFGVFGGGGVTDQDDDSTDTTDLWFVGLEGQLYAGNWTFYAQGGYLDSSGEGPDDSISDAGFARLVTRYFINPNTRIEGGVAGAIGKMDGGDDDVWLANWNLGVEHQFAGTPFAMFAAYEGAYYDQDADDDQITEHTVKIGARFTFGGGSEDLLSKDRYGVSLDTPNVLRWSGITGGQLE